MGICHHHRVQDLHREGGADLARYTRDQSYHIASVGAMLPEKQWNQLVPIIASVGAGPVPAFRQDTEIASPIGAPSISKGVIYTSSCQVYESLGYMSCRHAVHIYHC